MSLSEEQTVAEHHPTAEGGIVGRLLLLAVFGLFCVSPVVPASGGVALAVAGVVVALATIAVAGYSAGCLALLCAAVLVSARLNPWWSWPMHMLVPLGAYAIIVAVVPPLRRSLEWPPRGRFDRVTVALSILTVVVSSAALVVWFGIVKPDVGDIRAQVPPLPTWMLPLACLVFAVVNALMEEAVWRWILWDLLSRAVPFAAAVIVLQAVSFGLAHIHGFPRGWIGVGMAGLYGLFLGLIRWRSGGIVAPIVAHVFADATIFVILVAMVAE